jgi:hypothetical protein
LFLFVVSGDASDRIAFVNRRDKNGSTVAMHCVWPGHYKVNNTKTKIQTHHQN